ncbi:uncharacterized protein LOC133802077 [Humulus lupulus]|uniref:uncharacterized protein LOC133802077 n=1 Tax=Humulus lupulus TaxID=3486 RepID=UPI002B409976|nr:uncharacterized protein LOC133802077 [Humulus lupulus]
MTVAECWRKEVQGTPMYCLITKLKRLRIDLKNLNREGKGDVFMQDATKNRLMMDIQDQLQLDPGNIQLIEEEIDRRKEYQLAHKNLVQFLKQKVKEDWLKQGDENTKFFHNSIRNRHIQNAIYSIWDMEGNWHDRQEEVHNTFYAYYEGLLGSEMKNRRNVLDSVVQSGPMISDQQAIFLLKKYTVEEVKSALYSIPDEKAPGPDGYNSGFFKQTWNITGDELTHAVLSFLHSGKILKEINTTNISLIPKSSCPKNVSEYRPIACCNVVYKIATKMICSRLREVLPSIISENQSGFIKGRNIAHNIMLCQDLVRGYGRRNTQAACLFKIDLQKAYDSLD